MRILHRAGRALQRAGRLVRDSVRCSGRCCGCTSVYRLSACENTGLPPDEGGPSGPTAPCPTDVPPIYVCRSAIDRDGVVLYNGLCYVVAPFSVLPRDEVPEGAVVLETVEEWADDCQDPRCGATRVFYEAIPCDPANAQWGRVFVCRNGLEYRCRTFRYQPPNAPAGFYCYTVDQSRVVDEDDLPPGALFVLEVPPGTGFENCCECEVGCQQETVDNAPCSDQDEPLSCCCGRTDFSITRDWYYRSYREIRNDSVEDPFFGRFQQSELVLEETITPAVMECRNGVVTVNQGRGRRTITVCVGPGDDSTPPNCSTTVEEFDLEGLGGFSCQTCILPEPTVERYTNAQGQMVCIGQAFGTVPPFGSVVYRTWRNLPSQTCQQSKTDIYVKEESPTGSGTYTERTRRETFTIDDRAPGRCQGGCDRLTQVETATTDQLLQIVNG